MPADRLFHKKAGHSKKVSGLSDLEHRVWTQYILSADDYGVMRASAIALQADNDALAERPLADVQAAIDALVAVGLVQTFDHQGCRYLYQLDWQDFQKVTWPAKTIHPAPLAAALQRCTPATQVLFETHPGGKKVAGTKRGSNGSGGGDDADDDRRSEVLSGTSPIVPRSTSEVLSGTPQRRQPRTPATRDRARAKRLGLTATATADGSRPEEGAGETIPPIDAWLRQLQDRYPAQGLTSGYLTDSAFLDAIADDGRSPAVVFADMLAHLDNQMAGYQWRVKRMVPKLERWLREGLWRQLHDAQPPTAIVSERTIQNELAADAFVKGGGRAH